MAFQDNHEARDGNGGQQAGRPDQALEYRLKRQVNGSQGHDAAASMTQLSRADSAGSPDASLVRPDAALAGTLVAIVVAVGVFTWGVSGNPRVSIGDVAKAGTLAVAVGFAIAALSRYRMPPLAAFSIIALVAGLWFFS